MEHLLVIFVASASVHVQFAEGQVQTRIAGCLCLVALIVVEVVHFLIEIQFVGAVVAGDEDRVGDVVEEQESLWQCVVGLPAILELSCTIAAGAVFSVCPCLQGGFYGAYAKVFFVVGSRRGNVLIKLRELAFDAIDSHGLVGTVGTLNQPAVG